MTLTFPNPSRSFDATRDAVHFWGYDSAIECSFFVTRSALAPCAAAIAGSARPPSRV